MDSSSRLLRSSRLPLLAIAAAFAVVSTSCAGAGGGGAASGSASPKAPADQVTVLTDFMLFGFHSPFFAGKAEGFFRDQNIDVTIQVGKGSVDTAAQIGAGTVPFGNVDITTALVAISKGADIMPVAVYLQRFPGGLLYIKERTTINSWKDIEGKTIGAAAGDAYMVALPGLMRQNNADPGKYKVVTMASAVTTGALISGQVQAISGSAITAPSRAAAARAQGLTLGRFGFADNGYRAVGFALVANGKTVRDNPDLVQRFVNAWAKAVLWSIKNKDKAVADFLTANPDKQKDLEMASFAETIPLIKGEDNVYFRFEPAQVQINVDFVNQQYNASLKIADVYTNKFVDRLPNGFTQGKLP